MSFQTWLVAGANEIGGVNVTLQLGHVRSDMVRALVIGLVVMYFELQLAIAFQSW